MRASPSARSTVGVQPEQPRAARGSLTQSAVSQSRPGWAPGTVAIGRPVTRDAVATSSSVAVCTPVPMLSTVPPGRSSASAARTQASTTSSTYTQSRRLTRAGSGRAAPVRAASSTTGTSRVGWSPGP